MLKNIVIQFIFGDDSVYEFTEFGDALDFIQGYRAYVTQVENAIIPTENLLCNILTDGLSTSSQEIINRQMKLLNNEFFKQGSADHGSSIN